MWKYGKGPRLLSNMELKSSCKGLSLLFRKISILSEAHAKSLLHSLTTRLKTVLSLHIGMSVPPGTTAMLLHCCPCLINLVLHGGGNSLCQFHIILNALNNLMYLRYLFIGPALFFFKCASCISQTCSHSFVLHIWIWPLIGLSTQLLVGSSIYTTWHTCQWPGKWVAQPLPLCWHYSNTKISSWFCCGWMRLMLNLG